MNCSLKEVHKLRALIGRPLMEYTDLVGLFSKVNLNALAHKFFLVFLLDLMFSTMPHKCGVFLTELVIRLSTCAQHQKHLIILDIFVVKNCTGLLPVRVLKQLCLKDLLFN